jgi:hypothetical protein
MLGFAEPVIGPDPLALPILRAAPLIPAHAGFQTGSPRSRGRAEIYRLLCNSDAAAQPRKDSHGMEVLD